MREHRWNRVEYERLVDLGLFKPGENLELLDGVRPTESLVSRFGWVYVESQVLRRGEIVAPVAAPAARVAVEDLLP